MNDYKDDLAKIDLFNYKILDIRNSEEVIKNIKECYINNKTNKLEVYFNKKDNQDAQSNPCIYNSTSYKIEEKTPSEKLNSLFNYFYEISKHMKSDDSGQYDKSFLQREYDKIKMFDEKHISKDSIAFLYAQGGPTGLLNYSKLNHNYIYPFKTNYSQYKAIDNAFSYKISVIEGPPGTGKTQTILNLIANIIIQGKTVAIVSNNNSAFENVYKKLSDDKYKYNFFCAILGNKKNKETFIQQNNSKDNIYPDLDNKNRLKSFNYQQTFKAVNYLMKQMLEIFSLTSEKAKFVHELENVKLAYKNAKKTLDSTDIGPLYLSLIRHIKSKIINKYIYKIEKKNKFSFFMKLKLAYIHKIGSFAYLSSMSVKEILDSLKTLFFELKIEELNKKINFISNKLSLLNSKQIEEELQIKSQDILNYALIKRYNKSEPRKIFTLEDLSDSSKVDDFLQEYPVILSTTDSIRNSLNLGDKLYDYLIIDESSQVNLVSGFLALTTAKNLIIVGDNKQLSHIIEQNLSDIVLQINQNYMYLLNKYDVINYNLLTSIMRVFQIADNSKNRVLLQEHYRCHPKIIEFCNKKFYNEELIILSEDNNEPNVLRAFITSKGNHAIDNKNVKHINFREVDVIKNEILPALYKKVAKDQIGIIAPYKNQKELLQSEIDGIKINTIHSFQGQEMDAIIITTVDNEKKDFSDADELINVAISRAKKYLFVVTSYGIYHGKHGNIKDLISHIQYNLCEIDESKIKSIFDILYQENDNLLNEYIRKQDKNIIKQQIKKQNQIYKTNIDENKIEKSEIIGYFEIKKYIKEHYPFLNILVFIPLKVIININAKLENPLSEEEIQFINADSHIDFLLINKFNKQIFLAIEIDGYYFHSKSKQKINDKKKEDILNKYNIETKRFSTRGSEELKELDKKIQDIIESAK